MRPGIRHVSLCQANFHGFDCATHIGLQLTGVGVVNQIRVIIRHRAGRHQLMRVIADMYGRLSRGPKLLVPARVMIMRQAVLAINLTAVYCDGYVVASIRRARLVGPVVFYANIGEYIDDAPAICIRTYCKPGHDMRMGIAAAVSDSFVVMNQPFCRLASTQPDFSRAFFKQRSSRRGIHRSTQGNTHYGIVSGRQQIRQVNRARGARSASSGQFDCQFFICIDARQHGRQDGVT